MRYLSDEWIAAADQAVRSAISPPETRLRIKQHVVGVGAWLVELGPEPTIGRCSPDTAADASFTQSEATARDIARGQLDAHQAFLLGSIEFEGDVAVVIAGREALGWLQGVLAPVMARTDWD